MRLRPILVIQISRQERFHALAQRPPVLGFTQNIFDRAGHFIFWRSLGKQRGNIIAKMTILRADNQASGGVYCMSHQTNFQIFHIIVPN